MPECRTCHEPMLDFPELAKHILDNQPTHTKKDIIWARGFLLKHAMLEKRMPERTPYNDQDRLNREACIREISGRSKIVETFCMNCKRTMRQNLPVEFADNPLAWRVNKVLVITCENCQNKNRR